MVESVEMFTPSHLKTSKKAKAPNKKSRCSKKKYKRWKSSSQSRTKQKRSSYTDAKSTCKNIPDKEIDEIELTSQESISLLQDCCESKSDFPELIETCMNSHLEMITINSEEEGEIRDMKKSSQNMYCNDDDCSAPKEGRNSKNTSPTDGSIFCDKTTTATEENGSHNAKFIGCIIKLKCLLSSKTEDSADRLLKAFNKYTPEEINTSTIFVEKSGTSTDDIDKYLIESNNVDGGFQDTITSLLAYFETALEMDLEQIAFSWKNSIYELATKMLSESVEREPKVRKQVDLFLGRIIASISKNETGIKNLAQETKTSFLVKFCQPVYYCCDAINHAIKKIILLKNVKLGRCSSLDMRLTRIRMTKNAYYLLRALQKLLVIFKSKSEKKEVETAAEKQERQNFNVLEMWRKLWKKQEEGVMENKTHHRFTSNACKWCEDLDEVLVHCVVHLPLLANTVQECTRLAKDILKLRHTEIMEFDGQAVERQNSDEILDFSCTMNS